jgi:hypothetical protein
MILHQTLVVFALMDRLMAVVQILHFNGSPKGTLQLFCNCNNKIFILFLSFIIYLVDVEICLVLMLNGNKGVFLFRGTNLFNVDPTSDII